MPPNRIYYRNYKTFDKRKYKEWENQFFRVFNKHAPLKSKFILQTRSVEIKQGWTNLLLRA